MYYKDDKLVSELLSFFRNNDRKTYLLSEVAEKSGIPAKILSKWRQKAEQDDQYKPGSKY